jgi:hypothetical protein
MSNRWISPVLIALALIACKSPDQSPKPSASISQEYFFCSKCGSLHGGIFGKGPVLALHSKSAPLCVHEWLLIPMSEFQTRAESTFPSEWAQALPVFKR